ncbi:hypothetical protein KCU99_g36, partial [Aureobasidium melanogenum]
MIQESDVLMFIFTKDIRESGLAWWCSGYHALVCKSPPVRRKEGSLGEVGFDSCPCHDDSLISSLGPLPLAGHFFCNFFSDIMISLLVYAIAFFFYRIS